MLAVELALFAGLLSACVGYIATVDRDSQWLGSAATLAVLFFLAALGFAPAKPREAESWLTLAQAFVSHATTEIWLFIAAVGGIAVFSALTWIMLPRRVYAFVVRCQDPGFVQWKDWLNASSFRSCTDPLELKMWQPFRSAEEAERTIRCVQTGETSPPFEPERYAFRELRCAFLDPAMSLVRDIEAGTEERRMSASLSLGHQAERVVAADAVRALLRALYDESPKVEAAAATSLGDFGRRAASARPALLQRLSHMPRGADVGAAAAKSLGQIGLTDRELPSLRLLLRNPSQAVRANAAVAIAENSAVDVFPKILPDLIEALKTEAGRADSDPVVTIKLIKAIAKGGPQAKSALPVLQMFLNREEEIQNEANQALQALGVPPP